MYRMYHYYILFAYNEINLYPPIDIKILLSSWYNQKIMKTEEKLIFRPAIWGL